MKYCKQCGSEMTDDMRKCPNCGTINSDVFPKWNICLVGCDVVGCLLLFVGWVQISALGMTKAISPMQLVSYLRNADTYIGSYLDGYSDKVGLITACGVCLIAAYVVSTILAVMKKDSAAWVGLIAHLLMIILSGEVVSVVGKIAQYMYQMVTVTPAVHIAFALSTVAAVLCAYVVVLTFHLGQKESN